MDTRHDLREDAYGEPNVIEGDVLVGDAEEYHDY
jgi:hypothetical protein